MDSAILIVVCIWSLLAIATILFLVILFVKPANNTTEKRTGKPTRKWIWEWPWERAGRLGEEYATGFISSILNDEDRLFTNVKVSYEGKDAELDEVIVNPRGVFVIEVKNYKGELRGDAADYEWIKYKTSDSGEVYEKTVRNPIKQVHRQEYIFSNYLRENGIKVWVEGYVFFVQQNSPVKVDCVLETIDDIDMAIHSGTDNGMTEDEIWKTIELLGANNSN